MPFIAAKGSRRRRSGASGAWAGHGRRVTGGESRAATGCRRRRSARRGRRRDAWLLARRQRLAATAVDRLVLDRRQAALVVRDDEQRLELVEVGGRLEVGCLDDRVGVTLDIDDLADEEALRVGRAHAARKL